MTTRSTSASPPIYPFYCFSASSTFNSWAKLTAADVHALRTVPDFEGQQIYFYSNHPIKYVKLVGVLVGFDDFTNEKWGFMDLDDGSGYTIEVKWAKPSPPPTAALKEKDKLLKGQNRVRGDDIVKAADLQESKADIKNRDGESIDMSGIDLGSVVQIRGSIDSFRGVRQMVLERIKAIFQAHKKWYIGLVHTTNAEALAWEELTTFRTSVLSKPWYLSPEDQQQLLLESTAANRREQERERRRKEKKKREIQRGNKQASELRKDELRSEGRHQKRSNGRPEGEGSPERDRAVRESRESRKSNPSNKGSMSHSTNQHRSNELEIEPPVAKTKKKRSRKRQREDLSVLKDHG
ncbi:MAG: hypothetical protein M1812_005222 [Candelaria pacifica]|nr:MAG: hypothetical protein M1812_005222 [Candelaria pacifica]